MAVRIDRDILLVGPLYRRWHAPIKIKKTRRVHRNQPVARKHPKRAHGSRMPEARSNKEKEFFVVRTTQPTTCYHYTIHFHFSLYI